MVPVVVPGPSWWLWYNRRHRPLVVIEVLNTIGCGGEGRRDNVALRGDG